MERYNPKPSWFHNSLFEMVGAAVRTPGIGSVAKFRELKVGDQALIMGYYRAESHMESYMSYVAEKKSKTGGS